jgi:hypothetical protein
MRALILAATVLLSAAPALADEPSSEALALYAGKAAKLTATDADGWAKLAAWAGANGLTMESQGAYANALRADANHAGARAALGYEMLRGKWLRTADAKRAKGFVRYGGQWVLPAERDYLRKRDAAKAIAGAGLGDDAAGWVAALAATRDKRTAAEAALRGLPVQDRVKLLVDALEAKGTPAAVRAAACDLLGECRDLGAIRALTRASVTDTDLEVRAAALSALKAVQYRDTPLYLGSALRSKKRDVRKRAIEHLGTFKGDEQAARTLADYFVVGYGGGPRVNFYSLNQIAYIRDFDVEVAQAATIGDPITGRIEEGVVQDHKVIGGQEIVPAEAYALADSFKKVTGEDLGLDKKKYIAWMKQSLQAERKQQ